MRFNSRVRTACLATIAAVLLVLPLIDLVKAGERLTLVPNLEVDARAYDRFALDLARHPSLEALPPVFPPGFVMIVAMVYATVGHSLVAAKILLWLCLVLTTALARLLARRVYGTNAAGWTAALLAASSPALQGYTGTLQSEVLVAALILGLVLLALHAADTNAAGPLLRRTLVLAIAIGLALLIRESLIAFVPVFALFAAYRAACATRIAVGAAAAAIIVVGAAAPSAGWSGFQSIRVGHAMLIRDNVQGILPVGHNPEANGTWSVALAGIGQPAGLPFILAEPRQEVRLLARKFLYFWGVLRDGWNVPRPAAVWVARATGGLVPMDFLLPFARGGWLLIAFIVAAVALGRSGWQQFWLLPAMVAALMALHLATISSHRFAISILPIVFVLIAGPLARGRTRLKPRAVAVLIALAVAGLTMQMHVWPVTYRLQATELDGVNGENRREGDGRLVRVSDAARGRRVAFALYDEYLPRGRVMLQMMARRGTPSAPPSTPVARVRLFLLDGGTPCDVLISVDELPVQDQWMPVGVGCTLAHDGPARLIVDTLGRADLSFSEIVMQWRPT
jgi:hypothetical protein